MDDCPRWYVKTRLPASVDDPRGVFELPASFLRDPVGTAIFEAVVEPIDPSIVETSEVLSNALRRGTDEVVELTFCGIALRLNHHMQEELLTAITTFLMGVSCECPVNTQPFEAVN